MLIQQIAILLIVMVTASMQLTVWPRPLPKFERKIENLELVDNKYYLELKHKLNWHQAMEFCLFNNMSLISIMTEGDNDRIQKVFKDLNLAASPVNIWTSGNDLGERGHYFWASNGQPMTYTNWREYEPNHKLHAAAYSYETEHCVEYGLGPGHETQEILWNDVLCREKFNFICEVQQESPRIILIDGKSED